MGTASFSVGNIDGAVGTTNGEILTAVVKTSGAHTTTTTASNIEDASGDISLVTGDVIQIHADEAMRVRFGGIAATASTGHYIPAGAQREYLCTQPGVVSIIDVA